MYLLSRKIKNLQICRSFKSATNLGQLIMNLKIAKNIGSEIGKSANCHTCGSSANVTNFVSSQICGFPKAWGKMIHEKNLKAKNLVTLSLLSKTSVHTRIQWCQHTKLYKNTIYWDYPFKKQSEWIFEINIQEFIFQYRVFTKSIISHPFQNYFHRNNSIYKISTPLLQREGGNLQTDATQLFLFGPIPAKAKKLGLLSIYKFSLAVPLLICIWKILKAKAFLNKPERKSTY